METVILFKFASRSRPQKFFSCLDNIQENISDKKNYLIACTLDTDDNSMNTTANHAKLETYQNLTLLWGTSRNKIDAINRGMEGLKWDIIVNTSDDMWFTKRGFDEVIRNDMNNYFPDTDGVLHYNDGVAAERVMTLSILGRKYYERDNYIYHPDYVNLWADNEATEVAKIRGKHKYLSYSIFNHNHPSVGKAAYDDQYRRTESYYIIDGQTFEKRKAKNFI